MCKGRSRRDEQEDLLSHAIAPIWEANHVWLILAVVILFNGFPRAYAEICILYHVPLTLLLVGIIARGCAFTFRHYDVVKDRSDRIYTAVFQTASVLAPFAFGICVGALSEGRAPSGLGYASDFIWPWLSLFSVAVGVLACAMFAFLAAVYVMGETEDRELRALFARRAIAFNVLALLAGGAVFGIGVFEHVAFVNKFLRDPWADALMAAATLLLRPLWRGLRRHQVWTPRFISASMMACVLAGWMKAQFPLLLAHPLVHAGSSGAALTFANTLAPPATLHELVGALAVGSALIFPALIYLLKTRTAGGHGSA